MVTETLMKLRVAGLDFPGKKFFAPKIGKMDQKCTKTGLFEFIEKFGH